MSPRCKTKMDNHRSAKQRNHIIKKAIVPPDIFLGCIFFHQNCNIFFNISQSL
jgi:hypothetical protein